MIILLYLRDHQILLVQDIQLYLGQLSALLLFSFDVLHGSKVKKMNVFLLKHAILMFLNASLCVQFIK